MLDEFNNIRAFLHSRKVMFWYDGPVSQVLVAEIGDILRKSLAGDPGKRTAMRIFSILVEQMQNILRYSADVLVLSTPEGEERMGKGIVAVGKEASRYYIISGNTIRSNEAPRLRDRLAALSGMDRAGLKELYKTIRRGEPEAHSRGAGLGLVEMARKADGPLVYSVDRVDDDTSYFALKVVVDIND